MKQPQTKQPQQQTAPLQTPPLIQTSPPKLLQKKRLDLMQIPTQLILKVVVRLQA